MSRQIHLRKATEDDVLSIEMWAKAIDADQFMSRYLPERGRLILWKIVIVDGVEVGTAWIESRLGSVGVVFLGILLGNTQLLGQGIGRTVISYVIAEVRATVGEVRIQLTVRSRNARAIACYRKSGFVQIASGEKVGRDGTLIPTLTMEFVQAVAS